MKGKKMESNNKGIIFDIDGVLEYQGEVYPGAIETIAALRERGKVIRFLTNSTLKSRNSCAQKLRRRGFEISADEVVTASYAAAVYLQEQRPRSCWVMLDGAGLDEFRGFTHDRENPEYIVIGDNRSQFDFENLNRALRLLLKGSLLIGMQSELTDASMGEPELNVGSWVRMLELASGVQAKYTGKPNSYAFELAMKTIGLKKAEVVMVGDSISSDISGAGNYGIRSILVKTGEFDEQDLDRNIEPDHVIESITEVLGIVL